MLYMSICVVDRSRGEKVMKVFESHGCKKRFVFFGHGTAQRELLDRYGLEPTEKSVILSLGDHQLSQNLIKAAKRELYVELPGYGMMLTVPLKSVGGKNTMALISSSEIPEGTMPNISPDFELVIAIAKEGHTEQVMDAARLGGARGGTIVHGKGSGKSGAGKFFGVSLSSEVEMVLIVAGKEQKREIMKQIVEKAGAHTPCEAIVFSLPISDVAGIYVPDSSEEVSGENEES